MKLLYLWINNYKNMIVNQSFSISNSYYINFYMKHNRLNISKNKRYIENFYGNNILDIAAVVGKNGAGKTTVARFLCDNCESIHPYDDNEEYVIEDTNRIIVFEKENLLEKKNKLIIYYALSKELVIECSEDLVVEAIDLKNMSKKTFFEAEQEHDLTTVYFTNDFKINDVMNNQGFSEFISFGTHKSLCYTPMLSLHRAFNKLKNHYGADCGGKGQLNVINQYAQNMTVDFKIPYATELSYNFLVGVMHFSESIKKLLPEMREFELKITEFGEYIKFRKNFLGQSPFDQTVMFIRKNIYEFLMDKFKNNHWEQIYLNILCEIVLFLNVFTSGYKNVDFEVLKEENIPLNSEEAFEKILGQITDNEENISKKKIIREIRNAQYVDLNIIEHFINLDIENITILQDSKWFTQIRNFLEDYNNVKDIKIDQKINYEYKSLIELIVEHYYNDNTVYGRMISVVPQPMSSGEVAMINIFATVFSAMKKKTSKSILLVIDEIDSFLHPKWQQEILTYITEWINESRDFDNKKVQLIVATHSPIILSDVPRDKIIYLQKPFEVVSGEQMTFGANISTLFYDSFFMKEGSIGNIAKEQIQWVIDNIENNDLKPNDKKKLVYIIDNIGDKYLRQKLSSYHNYIQTKFLLELMN